MRSQKCKSQACRRRRRFGACGGFVWPVERSRYLDMADFIIRHVDLNEKHLREACAFSSSSLSFSLRSMASFTPENRITANTAIPVVAASFAACARV